MLVLDVVRKMFDDAKNELINMDFIVYSKYENSSKLHKYLSIFINLRKLILRYIGYSSLMIFMSKVLDDSVSHLVRCRLRTFLLGKRNHIIKDG